MKTRIPLVTPAIFAMAVLLASGETLANTPLVKFLAVSRHYAQSTDLIPDDRLLAERTGLTELEIRQLRGD